MELHAVLELAGTHVHRTTAQQLMHVTDRQTDRQMELHAVLELAGTHVHRTTAQHMHVTDRQTDRQTDGTACSP